jgi:hypothetical protein
LTNSFASAAQTGAAADPCFLSSADGAGGGANGEPGQVIVTYSDSTPEQASLSPVGVGFSFLLGRRRRNAASSRLAPMLALS